MNVKLCYMICYPLISGAAKDWANMLYLMSERGFEILLDNFLGIRIMKHNVCGLP